ncbi:mono/diheme cytochrome c family protein [Haloferula luteola]|uniref:Mono/diheme cytochrome c family protein n=1 Tax=Haloferula luteola TaxID=595692 RepID=A0A840VE75_9BACT|nr:c-type cytochrome [Haloferula luteola]MBB5353804.1 mono/diheme cytochrome c family protein [Haloferula luteola]
MEPSRDNPLARFAAFWWGIGVVSLFFVVLLITRLAKGGADAPDPLEEAARLKRLEVRAKVDESQKSHLNSWTVSQDGSTVKANPDAVFDLIGKQLVASKPTASTDAAQVVPGSATAEKLAAAPAGDTSAVDDLTAPAGTAPDAAVMEKGKQAFMLCAACHGLNGEGGPVGPPLAGSDWVAGPVSNLIRIQMRGLEGPITVAGKEYNFPAPMAPMGAASSDEDVAAVLTYVRNSFGNTAPPVSAEQVKMLRSEVGKPALKQADLIPVAP